MRLKELKNKSKKCGYTYGDMQLACLGLAYELYQNNQLDRNQTQVYLDIMSVTFGVVASTPVMAKNLISMGKEALEIMESQNE